MTASDVASLVRQQLENYKYPLTTATTLGKPWSLEKIDSELASLRSALVLPSQRLLLDHKQREQTVWLVAADSKAAVYFDQNGKEFGLGFLTPEGTIEDSNVRGDLVSTFMAR